MRHHSVAQPESVADMAHRLLLGAAEFRQEEILLTPQAVNHDDNFAREQADRRGRAVAVATLIQALNEYDGSWLDVGPARDIARRVVDAYLKNGGKR